MGHTCGEQQLQHSDRHQSRTRKIKDLNLDGRLKFQDGGAQIHTLYRRYKSGQLRSLALPQWRLLVLVVCVQYFSTL